MVFRSFPKKKNSEQAPLQTRFSAEEWRKSKAKSKKPHKYGANSEKGPNGYWDSQLEKSVYDQLNFRARAGEIRDIQRQVTVDITPSPFRIRLRLDFTFEQVSPNHPKFSVGERVAVEAKGFETAEWDIKLKLWRWIGPMQMELWKGTHQRPKLVEIISPLRPEASFQDDSGPNKTIPPTP